MLSWGFDNFCWTPLKLKLGKFQNISERPLILLEEKNHILETMVYDYFLVAEQLYKHRCLYVSCYTCLNSYILQKSFHVFVLFHLSTIQLNSTVKGSATDETTVQSSAQYVCTHSCPNTTSKGAPRPAHPKNNTDSLSNPIINLI